jgi:hypothetical protein
VSGTKYLVLGLVFAAYGTVFRDVNSAFNSLAMSIDKLVGAGDLFSSWMSQLGQYWSQNGNQSLWSVIGGGISGLLDALLIVVAYLLFPITYALFAFFYSLYGSILYVCGPLVLALLPAYGMGQLARTYLVNLLIFQAWGLIYAIIAVLTFAINAQSLNNVLNAGSVGGFFKGAGQDLAHVVLPHYPIGDFGSILHPMDFLDSEHHVGPRSLLHVLKGPHLEIRNDVVFLDLAHRVVIAQLA